MFKTLALAAAFAVTAIGAVSASTVTTLGGSYVYGAVEPPQGQSFTFDVDDGTATELTMDLSVWHRWPSWGSETTVSFTAPGGETFAYSGADFGWGNSAGYHSTSYTASIAPTDAGGSWTVAFNDSYDDWRRPDYFLKPGSYVSVGGHVAPIPLPAAAPLVLLGLGALGGLRLAQRRRSA